MSAEFLRFLGTINPPEVLDQKVQSLQGELQKHEGQFVLVVYRKWEKHGWDMPEWRTPYGLEEKFYLGLIRAPFLERFPELRSGSLMDFSISSDKHVAASERSGRDHVELVTGSIENSFTSIMSIWTLDMPVGERPGDQRWISSLDKEEEAKLVLEIVVGDEVVGDWFLNQAQYGRMGPFRKIVEDPNTDSETVGRLKRKHFDPDPLILYQKMQALLGREITSLPPEIQVQVEAKVLKQKEQVLASLEALVQQEAELTENLARIQGIKLSRTSFPLEDFSYEFEVQRDEADLRMWKSIPVTEERRRAQGQIKAKLKEALELGMHKDPWVIVREPKPGQRIEINVPELICGYCQYYEIPILQGKDSNK